MTGAARGVPERGRLLPSCSRAQRHLCSTEACQETRCLTSANVEAEGGGPKDMSLHARNS